jgi:hypothetical protein
VAKEFAGPDGVLLRVKLVEDSKARDISALSAIPREEEVRETT